MPVVRSYGCDICEYEFTMTHPSRDDPYPECPRCQGNTAWRPGTFAITGIKSKAIDYAQRIAEEDYGLTNMHDNQRVGDIAAMAPTPVTTAEVEAVTREIMEAAPAMNEEQKAMTANFWQHQNVNNQAPPGMIQAAMAGASIARAEGNDPIEKIHTAGKAGLDKMRLDVVGSDNPRIKPGSAIAR